MVRFNFVQGDSSHIPGFAVGRADGNSDERLKELCSALRLAGFIDAHEVSDVLPHIWDKLVCNASCNAVAAITGFTAEQIYGNEHTMAVMIGLGREVGAVAREKGIRLQFADEPERTFMGMGPSLGKNKLSMLQDVEAGRPTEIDSINGAVCLEGERLGVPTPMNSVVTRLTKAISSL
jgi:2-dehydropantoate 2-reductase